MRGKRKKLTKIYSRKMYTKGPRRRRITLKRVLKEVG
jgi:hypothetical protein